MKNLNFLRNLFGPAAGWQSSDVSVDRRLTVGSLSGLPTKSLLKLVSILVLMLTLGVGNVLGTDYTYSPTGSYTASGGKSTSNGKEWTYSSATYLGLNNSKIQVGSKNNPQTSDWTIQIPVSSFGTVTKVQLTAYTTATSASYKIGINGNTTSGSLSTSSATYTKTYTATSGDIVITLKGSANSKAMYLCSIVVTYTAASYTITYNANGGSGSMSNTTGASVNAAANGFTAPAGKQFTGWNTAANGSGTSYAAGASVNATVTLYAQWGCITPSISVHPSNGSCVQGGSPTPLTVTASGGTLSYQWKECSTSGGTYVNVTGGSGGTSASYTPPVSSVGTMYYKCVVTNTGSSCGTTATSNYASFEVTEACSAPTINTHPTGGVTYNMNVTATALSVTATKNGTGPALTYQWYSNTSNSNSTGTIIAGATSSSYTPPTSAAGTKYYYCIVSSGACSTPSNTAAITVSTPTITVSETARAFGDRKVNGGPYELTLTVGGTTLANGQGIGLAITGTNAAMFAIKNSVTSIAQTSSGTVATTTVTVQYSPTGAGSHSATLTFSSTGATSKMVALTGTGKWEVTWSNNGATSTTLVENSTKPTFPSTPLSCDATSTTFIGWATAEWDGKIASLAGKTVHTSNSTMSNITANGTTFYAVFAKQSGSGDPTWVQTTSVAENDVVVIAEIDHYADGKTGKELAGWGGSTYGTGTDYTTTPAGTITWTVVTGYNSTGVAFKNSSNKYLYWGSSNSLDVNSTLSANSSWSVSEESSRAKIQNNATNTRVICWNEASPRFAAYDSKSHEQETSNGASTKFYYPVFYKQTPGYTYSDYLTTCCSDPELAYGTASVTKTFGASAFTNTLTNSHSVAVTYASSDPTVATVDGSGEVTILKAGSTTITASSIAQTVSTVDYCADEASYTLTVNKASISPTLTYSPASVAVDANSNAPSVSDNTGSGTVTYAITDAKPAGCATINASTGVVTGVAVGSVTVTATVGATTNYNGNTATATVTITAASYFTNGETVFIQADSKDYSAWKDDACVKAWFNNNWSGGSAETTYWLFDATDDDAGKKLFAAVVPSASLNQVQLQRFAGNCSDKWNDNGSVTKASSNGVNTFRSYGSADNNVAWNGSSTILYLYGSQNSWGSSLGTFADQGSGVWTATLSNYAPDATSKDYKIKIFQFIFGQRQ